MLPGSRHQLATSTVRVAILITGLLSGFVQRSAAQTWYESYDQAEEALENENWSEAIRYINSALQQKPESSARARTYGMRFIDYFPFFKLGVAYQHLGQTDAALQAFETEERQGEIQSSEDDFAALRSYREGVIEARAAAEDDRRARAEQVVKENLRRAEQFEQRGRLDDALDAIGKVVAVEPEHEGAQALRRRVLSALAQREREQELEQRIGRLVEQGRRELAAGDFRPAAANFAQALDLRNDADTAALLERAQQGIRADLAAQQSRTDESDRANDTRRQQVVARSLESAARLETSGDLDGALRELQAVLALDSNHPDAQSAQRRILETRVSAGRAERVESLLSDAEAQIELRDFEGALRSANRILAIEPSHDGALRQIARAYAGLSDALLATDNAPPSILFDDQRQAGPDGALVETVRAPGFVLSGTVYDNSPVELALRSGDERVGAAHVQSRELLGLWITDFRFQHELTPGVSALELVATDRGGEETVEGYTVEYVVPFTRSVWFPVSIAAGLMLGGVAVIGSKYYRRQSLLRRRFNPYVAGAPILEQKRFFGRDQLLEYVLRRIHNNSILLYGERRIGKTSFQHRLKKCLEALDDPDHQFYPVFIDLQGTPEERFFATLASEIFEELRPILNGLDPHPSLDQGAYGYREFVKDLHGVVKALKVCSSKRAKLVLLIDEVDELNDYDPRVNQKLRSLFMRTFADNLVAVVSGVAIKKHWEREGSPWYNFFQEIEVQPLDPAEAAALIEAPVKGVFTFADGVVDEILRRTSCKPYLIQRICCVLVDRGHQEQRRSFTVSDVEIVCQPEGL